MKSTVFIKHLSKAFQKLFHDDTLLFDLGIGGINEQTLTFRLGLYLSEQFQRHDIDCEYNRLWDGVKKCHGMGITWMKPDVIVHRRNSDKANLFCLEAKKQSEWRSLSEIPRDIEKKLRALTHPNEAYRYRVGLAWRISTSNAPNTHDAIWFVGGVPVLITSLSEFESSLGAKLTELGVFG